MPAPDGVSVDHRHVGDPVDDALARLADPLVEELTGGEPERIRICANDQCRWVFYDTSRTSRRRWCDMATCGNRAKAARHRARAKESAERPRDCAARPTRRRSSSSTSGGRPGTWSRTVWMTCAAPSRADDSAGTTIFVFGLAANFESVSSWRIATRSGFGFPALIAP